MKVIHIAIVVVIIKRFSYLGQIIHQQILKLNLKQILEMEKLEIRPFMAN